MNIIKFNLDELKKKQDGFSLYILGRSYDLEENGVKQDYYEALKYYERGHNLQYPLCSYSLGISYILGLGNALELDNGNGTEKDFKLSEYYLRLAKEAGLKRAIEKYEEYEFGEAR